MLCGYLPFFGDSQPELFASIVTGVFEFDAEYWDPISKEAHDFVSQCLRLEPSARMTAHQAMQHPWLRTKSNTDILPASKKYVHAKKFKKAGMAIIGVNRLKKMSIHDALKDE